MRAVTTLLIVAIVLGSGCASITAKPDVEVEAVNSSSRELTNAKAYFGDSVCSWGYLVPSSSKSYLYFPHSITVEATIEWDADSGHHSEKLDLREIYVPGASGTLTFTVLESRVVATFHKK